MIGWLSDNALLPAREYWDNQWVKTLIHPLAVAGVEPFATRLESRAGPRSSGSSSRPTSTSSSPAAKPRARGR